MIEPTIMKVSIRRGPLVCCTSYPRRDQHGSEERVLGYREPLVTRPDEAHSP